MQQLDRRRAMLSGSNGSGWDFEFYASSGVFPPESKMIIHMINASQSGQSTSGFTNGYYRLNGITSSDVGGIGLRVKDPFLSLKCEAEWAFYIRRFSQNEHAVQFNLRSTEGQDFYMRFQRGYICMFKQVNSSISEAHLHRTSYVDTRYVMRCDIDGENGIAHAYLNDELIITKSADFITNSPKYSAQIIALSGGANTLAQVDVEYFRYRKL